ncbi:MAG TPA: right-handed parallel beta-helix repeat-containing protein, partial [Caldilineaceae bacterium]|nr:right-handed parallel beta-helix repeat-containing protein [Caldilineaceae bacterium]
MAERGLAFFVAVDGDDAQPGSEAQPFATLARAQAAVAAAKATSPGPITVYLREGAYYLAAPLSFGPGDSGTPDAPIRYTAYPGERVTLSGGRRLTCAWQPYRDGIWRCRLPEVAAGRLAFTQLFVNGKRQTRARYPNADPSDPKRYTGYLLAAGSVADDLPHPAPDPDDDMTFSSGAPRGVRFDPATFSPRAWSRPEEAVIHIYQAYAWGNLQWQLKAVDREQQILWFGRGGYQMGAKWHAAPCLVDERSHYYVENVFEELDAPGEWYLDRHEGILYYLPPDGVDLATALVEAPVLQQVVRFVGSQAQPVHDITLHGFRITHTASTFLEPYVVPSLSDWSIHRGGAVYLEGTRRCRIEGCFFDAVGGNAVFVSNYNREAVVTGCKFTECGESAICFVGSLEATVGTQRAFPYECEASNNLIHDCGVFGKQIAGVYISRAKRITAAHNHIYNMPRAGICIGDGTWGGHVIEYNFIHDTCRETGDHGPFNAWGRDKYWCLVQSHMPYTRSRSHDAGHVLVDAMEPVILRYNLFREQAGWGLDLDDGASNYEIYKNVCVGVSMKLREGAYRTIYNNIWINGANSPCFHVGNEDNHDRYVRNITVMSV